MIDVLATWRSTLAALPKTSDASWAPNFAAWVSDRISATGAADSKGIETKPTNLTLVSPPPAGFVFTFNQSMFASQLTSLAPTTDAAAGIQGFADAWASTIATTIFPTTLNVMPGAFIPPTSPTTLFSAITSVILDPSSVTAAKAKIIELATAPPTDDPNTSQFPEKFRDAFLLLTISIVGLDSTTPTPLPLMANNIPLI